MSHYRANVADVRFNLFEVFGRDKLLGSGPWPDLDVATIESMLEAGAALATNELAPSYQDADFGSIDFDPSTGTATMPAGFRHSFDKYVEAEWWRMDIPVELGGIAVPQSLRWAMAEFALAANPAVFLYASGWAQAQILYRQGTPEQKRFAQFMTDRHWGATMVLTEPDAGSAVGSGKTKAIAQPDGSWHIQGVKRFITSAEHDLSENIAHFVLARPVDTPGAGGPGTKGLSLFLVPKFHVDFETGELGARNGAMVTNIERKMGLKASTTFELTFGQDTPAVGWLVGDVHNGIAQMFEVVEYARMLVGTKAMATLSSGYLNALDYAKSRLQSPDITQKHDRSAPDIAIIGHPDVRRSLLLQKAHAEGMRALVMLAACGLDDIQLAQYEGRDASGHVARNDLLLPIVKGYCSEKGYALLGESLQIFGGSGYLQDYPIEQYIRDAKIDTIYEGTTTIQGLDFFFRKIVRDDGQAFDQLVSEIEAFAQSAAGADSAVGADLAAALGEVRAVVATLRGWSERSAHDSSETYRVALSTTRLLFLVGDLLVGWLLARQASIAAARLRLDSLPSEDVAFYRGKMATAAFFAAERLAFFPAERLAIEQTTLAVMELPDNAF